MEGAGVGREEVQTGDGAGTKEGLVVTVDAIIERMRAERDEAARAGMARYGINVANAVGMPMSKVRALAKELVRELGRNNPERHRLAAELWSTGLHEARLLAGLVDLPQLVTAEQMEAWVADLDSWDVCDQLCMNLFGDTLLAWSKALEWSGREEEFVKRAGFALMAVLASHDKTSPDECFLPFFAAIEREAGDSRNFVKKAVNWALRQMGKRNEALRREAAAVAGRLAGSESRAARWVGKDALKELESEAVLRRLGGRA